MPIHTSWKSMVKGMAGSYKKGKMKCYPFTDGSKVCMRAKAWQVFFATVNKMGADETKPRPRKVKTGEANEKIIEWFLEAKQVKNNIPPWVFLAKKIINSSKANDKTKAFWKKRLTAWCAKNPKAGVCKK